MRFATTFAVFSALAAAVQAVNFTVLTFATVTAGKPFELSWTGAAGPVTLTLKNGNPQNLQTVSTIASGLSGNSYTWQVPSTLINLETYALEITDGVTTNYGAQFQLIGGASATGSSASRTATGSASQTGSVTSSASVSLTTNTQSLSSVITESSGTSSVGVRTTTGAVTRTTPVSSPTSTPPSGAAPGLSSNVALVLLAAGALFMIN
jgi:hypothetical protein